MRKEVMDTTEARRRGGVMSKQRFGGGGKAKAADPEPCGKSPTGYHHYVLPQYGVKVVGVCKHCKVSQEHVNLPTFDQADLPKEYQADGKYKQRARSIK